MRTLKKILTICLLSFYLLLPVTEIIGVTYDFTLTTDTTVNYTTGDEHVEVTTLYTREIKNKGYYFSKDGEQTIHIPDHPSNSDEDMRRERDYKLKSLSVTSDGRNRINYTVQEEELGKGIYVKIPNYKETTFSSNYRIYITYLTHDFVTKLYDWVVIEYPGLHKDTEFEQINSTDKTKTKISYNLNIVVDKNIPILAKVSPKKYTQKDDKEKTIYSFDGTERISNPVYVEFGTKQAYKFEITLDATKTDTFIPEKYSSVIDALSTNVYELSLPREFDENKQRVLIEKMEPQPTKIITDTEGNVIARFEVPANIDSQIYVSGYILQEQSSYQEKRSIPNLSYREYIDIVSKDVNFSKYLKPTAYWQSTDPFIIETAQSLLQDNKLFLDVIKNNYTYLNDILEYDTAKKERIESSSNYERIGAKEALQGGASVCMEYSDSMIAILRAQGIPSRAAFGFTSLSTDASNKIGHQWVQVWVPEYGWLSIDPSYESKNMMIGESLQYVLWDAFSQEDLSNIRFYSANNTDFDIKAYNVKIYAVDEKSVLESTTLIPYSEISFQEDKEDLRESVDLIVKTTLIGKALIIIVPIMIILLLLVVLLSLTKILIQRTKGRKADQF
ncbi:transglutaminase domain-containing protein [Candidatus Dojkabacteria bacterium]|uniref:Transglutaminase domain-containing protein n=1 Tax=Candidatus Dojkabacteria bacterium TaxID=2099670 RepID=A0A847VDC7_9BACT|nr:transglutaminase domain-containing protein [Candidatus Dojkabacteria bacterium]